jgi:hypothetical protein
MRPLLAGLCLCAAALAGGGPETTLLVANAASPMSRLVANEYAALRDIPRSHLVLLEGVPLEGIVPLAFFRERIWNPVAAHMKEQGLEGQIDLVVYSVDLPFGVSFPDPGQPYGGRASLTGLTFLIREVEAEEPFWLLDANGYYALGEKGNKDAARAATAEERSLFMRAQEAIKSQRWSEAATAYEAFLKTYDTHPAAWYDYACSLARLGNKQAALDALAKAVDNGFRNGAHAAQDPDLAPLRGMPAFDGQLKRMQGASKPSRGYRAGEGGFLSTQLGYTGRFGSTVPEVLAALKASVAADGTAPDGTVYFCKNGDIRSTTREPAWPALEAALRQRGRKVQLLEGVLPDGKDDVIGAVLGTAGFSWASSKSRILPGAIVEHLTSHGGDFSHGGQTKFSELVRYGAAGTSGAVMEPYALQAKFPHPMIHVFYADGCSLAEAFFQSVWGPFQLMVAGDGLARPFAKFEKVAIDAPPMPWSGTVKIGGGSELWVDGRRMDSFDLDTTKLDDGWHDVRVVLVSVDEVATRSYGKLDAVVKNRNRQVAMKGGPGGIEARCAGAKGYKLIDGARVVATSLDGKFAAPAVGPGPVDLLVIAEFDDGACRSEPLRFALPPSPPAPPSSPDRPVKPGLGGTVDGVPVALTTLDHLPKGKAVLEGWFEAERDGLYELVVTGRPAEALSLAKGWHPIRIEGEAPLSVMLGGEQALAPPRFEHATFGALPKPPEAPKGLEALVDGNRGQPGAAVPAEGLILSFKAATKDIVAVTLFPGNGPLPAGWTVETTSGSKWLPVKDLRVVVARPPAPVKDQPEVPAFIELSFAPVTAKKVRLVVKEAATLAEVEVLGRPKAKKK